MEFYWHDSNGPLWPVGILHARKKIAMLWLILSICAIVGVAILFRKASKGSPFERRCACTPYVEKLRGLEEKGEKPVEKLW